MSQVWSRYFSEQQGTYGRIEGLLSPSVYNDEPAVSLYERAADAMRCDPTDILPLVDPALRTQIEDAALRNNLYIP